MDGVNLVHRVDVGTTEGRLAKGRQLRLFCPLRPRARSLTIRLQTQLGCDDRKALLQID